MAAAAICSDEGRRAHFTYIWKIKSAARHGLLNSPVFTVQSMEMTKWYLRISSVMKTLVVARAEQDDGPESIEIESELSFLDTDGSILIKESGTEKFQKHGFKIFRFLNINEIFFERGRNFPPKGTLTVRCRIWRTGTEIKKSEMCFAITQFNLYQRSCFWVVKGFSSIQQGEKRIRILSSAIKRSPKLILTLFLSERNGKECVLIHVETPHIIDKFTILAEIALLDAEGMVSVSEQANEFLHQESKSFELNVYEKSKLISNKAVLLSDDVLVLRCEFQIISHDPLCNRIEDYKLMDYSDLETVLKENEMHFDELNETAVCPFKEIINKFRCDGTLSDVCLRSGSKSFPVHKLILSSRSPVFSAMFTKDMKEKNSKCIDIPDLDEDTMNRLLLYIYDNKIKELTWESAAGLFKAADKYELLDLKEKCSSFLKSNISISNVCEILVLADMHLDESLRKSVQEFILNNSEVIYSNVWKVFREDHTKLALETTEQIIYNLKHVGP